MSRLKKKPGAVFLDRDGTLTQRGALTWKKSQLRLQKGAARALNFFNKVRVPVIMVTNQSVVARGLISERGVLRLHDILQKRLGKKRAFLNAIYFCPHHPRADVKKYRRRCNCRKPGIGLFKLAGKDFNLNLRKSVVIGDMTADIAAGKKIGAKTILLKTGHGGKDKKYSAEPDYRAKNLNHALKIAKRILQK